MVYAARTGGSMNAIQNLVRFDSSNKAARSDEVGVELQELYDDSASTIIATQLKKLGVGIAEIDNPIHANLLKEIVDKLACVYSTPPTRWLRKAGKRLSETDSTHKHAMQIIGRAQLDQVWARVDRIRALHRQVFLRVYPQDSVGSVVVRLFEPFNVIRRFTAGAGDDLSQDAELALCLCAGSRDQQIWEHWAREGDRWTMTIVNGNGVATGQPFEAGANPYSVLPITLVSDEYLGGRAWLPPRASRAAWQAAINAGFADLQSMAVNQAHSNSIWSLRPEHQIPGATGHNTAVKLDIEANEKVEYVTPNPQIGQCLTILAEYVRTWLASESLPTDLFSSTPSVATGAALRAREAGLQARRKELVGFAAADEAALWRTIVAVHNVHAVAGGRWDLPPIDELLELETEVAEPNPVVDPQQLQQTSAADLALGALSVIDYLQVRDGLTRAEAIEAFDRIQRDRIAYPVGAITAQDGPRAAGTDGQVDPSSVEAKMASGDHVGLAELMKTPSVVDAIGADGQPAAAPEAVNGGGVAEPVKAADTAMNGAQVTSAIQIVTLVAADDLPRESGVAMLIEFFSLSPEAAERVMGSVGKTFKPNAPEPPVGPPPGPPPLTAEPVQA